MALTQVVGPIPTVATVPTQIQGGRLSLSSTLPVPSSDITGATTVYLLPYNGRGVAVWNSTLQAWRVLSLPDAGISVALGTLTSGANYDVFVYDNNGSLALELSAAWGTNVLRNNAGSGTDLVQQDGVWIKKTAAGAVDKTRRYVGTFRTTATTTTEDSNANRFLWNMDNRVFRGSHQQDLTASWTDTTNTWKAANGGNANWKHSFVVGLDFDDVDAFAAIVTTIAGGQQGYWGIALDSSTAPSGSSNYAATSFANSVPLFCSYRDRPGLGYHFLQVIETVTGPTVTYNAGGFAIFRTGTRR